MLSTGSKSCQASQWQEGLIVFNGIRKAFALDAAAFGGAINACEQGAQWLLDKPQNTCPFVHICS